MPNETILVTGDRGTIGQRLIPHLKAQGFNVVGTRRPEEVTECEYNQVEIQPFCEIETSRIDVIINLAGLYANGSDPKTQERMFQANLGIAVSVANLGMTLKIPIIHAGTFFEFAPPEMSPWSGYSISKAAAAETFRESASRSQGGFMELVLYDNYGGSTGRKKFIDQLLELASAETALEATLGSQVQDLTHLDDVCRAFLTAVNFMLSNRKFVGVRQVRSREVLTLREIVSLFNAQRVEPLKVNWGSLNYRDKEVFQIWDSAPNLENWSATVKLKEYFENLS